MKKDRNYYERKRGVKIDFKVFGLGNLKDEFIIYQDGKDYKRNLFGKKDQEFVFGDVKLEIFIGNFR